MSSEAAEVVEESPPAPKEHTLFERIIGDYDWNFLCYPRFPFCNKGQEYPPPPFYAHDEPLSLFVALMIGLQHALTMSTNIITPALLVFNVVMSYFPETYNPALGDEQAANRERALDTAQYLVSASLICSGLGTMMQVSAIPIPFTKWQLGTGVLSTMGTANQVRFYDAFLCAQFWWTRHVTDSTRLTHVIFLWILFCCIFVRVVQCNLPRHLV